MAEQSPSSKTVSVVFASNDYYVPYLGTLLASIVDHCNPQRTYEFIVLCEDFTQLHIRQLRQLVERPNVSLRILDVSEPMRPYKDKLRVWAHFKRETYFRLLLPQILPDHHKVLYLDADMVCLSDVAPLFDTNIENYLVAACKDPDTTGIYNGVDVDLGQPDKRNYMDNVLKIKNPYEYFQAGTILFNLDEWRKSISVDEVFKFAQSNEWQLLDQDVLNYFCQGRTLHVDMAWNVMFDNCGFRIRDIISRTTPELRAEYMAARENPRIVHYAGPIKPWDDAECDFAEHFWRYAKQTPFYEVIICRMSSQGVQRVSAQLEETRAWIQSIDDELKRYENRPISLMFKELVYQKILTPLANRVAGKNGQKREQLHELYRKVHR